MQSAQAGSVDDLQVALQQGRPEEDFAVLPRDPALRGDAAWARTADLLLARKGLLRITADNPMGLPDGAVLGTSSLRRAAQALASRPA